MRSLFLKIIIVGILCSFSNGVSAQNFEGELIYSFKVSGEFSVAGEEYKVKDQMIKRGEFYDSLTILYKGNQYKKTKNKKEQELNYFNLNEKRSAVIFDDKKEIIIDDLSFNNLINQPCRKIGAIQNVEVSDTTLLAFNLPCKYIVIIGEYGNEKYIIAEDFPKLSVNRNILQDEGCQVYSEDFSKLINNSILIFYEIEAMNVVATYSLVVHTPKELNQSEVDIPAYKEKRRNKRFNKFSQRFKTYTLVNK